MEKLLFEVRAMRDNVVKNGRTFHKDDLIFEGMMVELTPEAATNYFRRVLGHSPKDNCGCKPVKQLTPKDDYFAFPLNSPYGLNDCKEVVLNGKYTVNANAIKGSVLIEKPKHKANTPKDATPTV
jgi:hypothetical protein